MRRLRLLLLPLGALYWVATRLRNWLYAAGVLRAWSFVAPVVCVGNITVGGTGKTPVIERLAGLLLSRGWRVAVVSRGYRRKSRGQVVARDGAAAADVGDEPSLLKRHMPRVDVVVDADRAAAIDCALRRGAQVVLMDDGMQHRSVRPGALILVCDYARPLWRDWPLPAGDKRESAAMARTADVVLVNKCPSSLSRAEADAIRGKMRPRDGRRVFFSAIGYADFVTADGAVVSDAEIAARGAVAVAGIGRPAPFFGEVERRTGARTHMPFADHHDFKPADLARIGAALDGVGERSLLLTTEKDATRLPSRVGSHEVAALPIRTDILFGEADEFDNEILHIIKALV